jgi:tRNA(Ile)-lysidine synthase
MITLLEKIPENIAVAVSGGADSMAALDFLHNGGKRSVTILHFNHGSEHADEAESFVREYAEEKGLPLFAGKLTRELRPRESKECYWREQRYAFFNLFSSTVGKGIPIVTCHHLDDLVETWIFTSLHGTPRLIPRRRDNYVRPFLSTRKAELLSWCKRKGVPYVEDPSNSNTSYMRNYIRHVLLPSALRVNPGIHKVLRKKIIENENRD